MKRSTWATLALLVCAATVSAQDLPRPSQTIGAASHLTYDNSTSLLTGDTVQEAIDEIEAEEVDVFSAAACESQTGRKQWDICIQTADTPDSFWYCSTTTCTAAGWVEVGDGGGTVTLAGDVTGDSGSNTISANSVALGTDTTGGYAASSTEGGSATSVAANSVALGTDTTGGYAASVSEGGAATTATALAANGANCSDGQFPIGVDASGAVESCTNNYHLNSAIPSAIGFLAQWHTYDFEFHHPSDDPDSRSHSFTTQSAAQANIGTSIVAVSDLDNLAIPGVESGSTFRKYRTTGTVTIGDINADVTVVVKVHVGTNGTTADTVEAEASYFRPIFSAPHKESFAIPTAIFSPLSPTHKLTVSVTVTGDANTDIVADAEETYVSIDQIDNVGSGWIVTCNGGTGACSTNIGVDDMAPTMALQTETGVDNATVDLQWGYSGHSGEWIEPTVGRPYMLSTIWTHSNIAQDDVQEAEWFFGFAQRDTNVCIGSQDFIGLRKRDFTDDATGTIYFVSGRAGGNTGGLVDEHTTDTGWRALNTGQTMLQNRANKIMGPWDYNLWTIYVVPTMANTGGLAYVYVNGVGIDANPITLTHDGGASNSHPDTRLTLTACLKAGDADAEIGEMFGTFVGQSMVDANGDVESP